MSACCVCSVFPAHVENAGQEAKRVQFQRKRPASESPDSNGDRNAPRSVDAVALSPPEGATFLRCHDRDAERCWFVFTTRRNARLAALWKSRAPVRTLSQNDRRARCVTALFLFCVRPFPDGLLQLRQDLAAGQQHSAVRVRNVRLQPRLRLRRKCGPAPLEYRQIAGRCGNPPSRARSK